MFRVSIHAFRGEGDIALWTEAEIWSFQSTPSGGKATVSLVGGCGVGVCFNPRLPGGRRHQDAGANRVLINKFQSTPSGGKATRMSVALSR